MVPGLPIPPPNITGGSTDAIGGKSGNVNTSTGNKTLNFGGNPNIQTALQNPLLLVGVAVGLFLLWKHLK